ncbi:hypothetical protein TSOC_007455, partial [Tetrabaena socialis]
LNHCKQYGTIPVGACVPPGAVAPPRPPSPGPLPLPLGPEDGRSSRVPLMRERNSQQRLCVNCDTTYVPHGQVRARPYCLWGVCTVRNTLQAASRPWPSFQTVPCARTQDLRPVSRAVEPHVQQEQQEPGPSEGKGGSGAAAKSGSDSEQGDADEDEEVEPAYDEDSYDPRADARMGPFATTPAASSGAGASAPPNGRAAEATPAAAAAPAPAAAVAAAGSAAHAAPGAGRAAGPQEGGVHAATASTATPAALTSPSAPAATASAPAAHAAPAAPEGWTLLDKYCPRCSTVLVRSRANRRMFCVACDAVVLAAVQRAPLAALPAATPDKPSALAPGHPALGNAILSAAALAPPLPADSAGAAALASASGRDGSEGPAPSGPDLLLSSLLERTSAADTERARAHLALLSDCLDFLAKLRSLR